VIHCRDRAGHDAHDAHGGCIPGGSQQAALDRASAHQRRRGRGGRGGRLWCTLAGAAQCEGRSKESSNATQTGASCGVQALFRRFLICRRVDETTSQFQHAHDSAHGICCARRRWPTRLQMRQPDAPHRTAPQRRIISRAGQCPHAARCTWLGAGRKSHPAISRLTVSQCVYLVLKHCARPPPPGPRRPVATRLRRLCAMVGAAAACSVDGWRRESPPWSAEAWGDGRLLG